MSRDPDSIVGTVAAVSGSTGLTIQLATNFGSIILIVLNLLLACGGLYLLRLRIIKAQHDNEEDRRDG